MRDFRGKVVYVVGGSSGIGLAAARRFSAAGAQVAIFARNQERLAVAMESIRAVRRAPEQQCACFCLDATSPTQTAEIMRQACESIGPPDVLLNSAGQATPHRFEETSFGQLERTIGVNLYATWNAIAALLPALKERRGYIVNVSSIAGFVGVFGYTDYSASKFAVMGFSEALRQELRPAGVTVSVLCPPDAQTPGFEEECKTRPPETAAIAAGARLMSPEDVAAGLLQGMRRRRRVIIPGAMGKLTYLAKRLLPGFVEWTLHRTIRRVQRRS